MYSTSGDADVKLGFVSKLKLEVQDISNEQDEPIEG